MLNNLRNSVSKRVLIELALIKICTPVMDSNTDSLYERRTNPFASCMPILIQMPVFFALFRVLASLQAVANGTYANHDSIGPLTAQLAADVQASTVFGAPLSASFMSTDDVTTKVVTVIMIIMMSATQWYTKIGRASCRERV